MKTTIYLMAIVFALTSCSKEDSNEDYTNYNYTNTNNGGSGSSGCPTTSSCGCSNKTKAQCEVSPCCKWTVGQGCGCR
jgi:hypothetical protein